MDGRAGHATRRARCSHQASRSVAGSFRRACKVGLCFVLAAALALVPLDFKIIDVGDSKHSNKLGLEVQESEAHAIVPVVAGGAAVAAAAELGISAEVLYLGTAALIAGATGYLVTSDSFQNMTSDLKTQWDRLFDGHDLSDMTNDNNYGDGYTDGSLQVGGTPLWDDLSSDEKAKFGTPAAYVQGTWDGLEAQVGLLQETGGGDWEPTPSGDGDPLSKLKNAIKIIGVTGGAVAVGEAAQALGDAVAGGIKGLLFGDGNATNGGLNVAYTGTYTFADKDFVFVTVSASNVVKSGNYSYFNVPNGWVFYNDMFANRKPYLIYPRVMEGTNSYPSYVDATIRNNSNIWSSYVNGDFYSIVLNTETGLWDHGSGSGYSANFTRDRIFLNAIYGGKYIFPDNVYQNGKWDTAILPTDVDYGQLEQTPDQITQYITGDQPTFISNVNNYENTAPDGQKYAVTMPSGYGDTAIQPDFSTFVQPMPETQVSPVPDTKPDDQPITPDPKPDDPTPPEGDWDFPKELDDAMKNLGEGAFGNLFPFCLVVDIQHLSDKLATSAGFGQTRGGLLMAQGSRAQFSEVVLPLSDFGIEGVDDLVLDCEPVFRLGLLMRSWWTILLMASLIAESVRYFLK